MSWVAGREPVALNLWLVDNVYTERVGLINPVPEAGCAVLTMTFVDALEAPQFDAIEAFVEGECEEPADGAEEVVGCFGPMSLDGLGWEGDAAWEVRIGELGVEGLGAIVRLVPSNAPGVGGIHVAAAMEIEPPRPFALLDDTGVHLKVDAMRIHAPDISAWCGSRHFTEVRRCT